MKLSYPHSLLAVALLFFMVMPLQGCALLETAVPAVPPRTMALFKEPVEPKVFELPSGALASWRDFAAQKPALVLFATHPLLAPLPETDREQLAEFIRTASAPELVRRARLSIADPALLPQQTVSAAIDAGLISELIFVQPTTKEGDKVSLDNFRQRAFTAGFLSEQEALSLEQQGSSLVGTLRGIPFRCVHPSALPTLERPVIVHVDLGYFQDLYVNDVKTPLDKLLFQTARNIRDAGWPALAVTLSYSNQEIELSLETRFMISNLAALLIEPQMVDGAIPPGWKLRADARYSKAMFADSASQEMLDKAASVAPDDPDTLFALSLQKFDQRLPNEAFALLERAVAIDPGYALAYLDLAETALLAGQVPKAIELLKKAQTTFPRQPFIPMSLANLYLRLDDKTEAAALLREIRRLPWSKTYHPEIPDMLDERLAQARTFVPEEELPVGP